MGVADGCPEEFEAPFFHVAAHGVRFGGYGGYLCQTPETVDDRLPVGEEGEDIVVETAELSLHGHEQAGVVDGGVDLPAVSDDAFEVRQPFGLFRRHLRYPPHVEAVECRVVALPLAEDREPRQSRLGAFEHQEFEQGPVVGDGPPPLLVVVFDIQFVGPGPAAAGVDKIVHRIRYMR